MNPKKFTIKGISSLIKETIKEWLKDRPLDQSAIVSFYSIFALPGLLMIIIAIAGRVFGQEAVEGKIEKELSEIIGKETGRGLQILIANAYTEGHSKLSTFIGAITLLFAATGVFSALQRSLNKTWKVKNDPGKNKLKKIIINRTLSFGMILAMGFLLLGSLVLTSVLPMLASYIKNNLSDYLLHLYYVLDFLLSFLLITTMFALIYKFLPDAKIPWKSVWIGAALAAVLFIIGKFSLGPILKKYSLAPPME